MRVIIWSRISLMLGLQLFFIALILGILISVIPQYNSNPYPEINASDAGRYLTYGRAGNDIIENTNIYLVDSHAKYGTFGEETEGIWNTSSRDWGYPKKGEPIVIISGTIRNDYDDRWVVLSADIYNTTNNKIDVPYFSFYGPWFPPFDTFQMKSHTTESFDVCIRYNQTDVGGYYIFLASRPGSYPPP